MHMVSKSSKHIKKLLSCQQNLKKRRQIVMEWWNSLNEQSKFQLGYNYFNRHYTSLTGREIEVIYNNKENI